MTSRLARFAGPRMRRRLAWGAGAGLAAVALPLALHVGAFSSPQPWDAATGWDEIPETERAPMTTSGWTSGDAEAPELHWLGHAGFLVRWHGAQILLDPNASERCTITRRTMLPPDLSSIGHVDAVVISHAHFDHFDAATLQGLGDVGAVMLPAGAERWLPEDLRERARLVPMRPGDVAAAGPLEVAAVTAAHEGNRWHPFSGRVDALGYVIRAGGEAVYFAGDTAVTNDFAAIREAWHPRLAILPIGAWLPRIPMKYYHLSPEEAVQAARELGVAGVVPCHFGTFAVSLDRPSWALPRFAKAAKEAGLAWTMPVPLGVAPASSPGAS